MDFHWDQCEKKVLFLDVSEPEEDKHHDVQTHRSLF